MAALAGVTIGGQKRSQAEEALANFRSSLDKMRDDHRLLSGVAQNAIKTFMTLITAAEDEGEEEDAEERSLARRRRCVSRRHGRSASRRLQPLRPAAAGPRGGAETLGCDTEALGRALGAAAHTGV